VADELGDPVSEMGRGQTPTRLAKTAVHSHRDAAESWASALAVYQVIWFSTRSFLYTARRSAKGAARNRRIPATPAPITASSSIRTSSFVRRWPCAETSAALRQVASTDSRWFPDQAVLRPARLPSRVRLIVSRPSSIACAVAAARSSGSRSAVHTKREPDPSVWTCAAPLWCE